MAAGRGRAQAAIFGCGLMGRWHLHAARRAGTRIAYLVDRDRAAAERLRRYARDAVAGDDPEPSLEDPAVRLVHVTTPLSSHAALADRALEARKNVLVEKPLTATAAAADDLLARARSVDRLLAPVHQTLFQAGVRRIYDGRRRLGTIRHLRCTIISAGADGRPAAERDAVVAEVVPHPASLIWLFADAPSFDQVELELVRSSAGEVAIVGSTGGQGFSILISLGARPTRFAFEVLGEHGSAEMDLFHGFAVEQGPGSRRRDKVLAPFRRSVRQFTAASWNLGARAGQREPAYPGLNALVAAFHGAALDGRPNPVPEAQTRFVARFCDALVGAMGRPW